MKPELSDVQLYENALAAAGPGCLPLAQLLLARLRALRGRARLREVDRELATVAALMVNYERGWCHGKKWAREEMLEATKRRKADLRGSQDELDHRRTIILSALRRLTIDDVEGATQILSGFAEEEIERQTTPPEPL